MRYKMKINEFIKKYRIVKKIIPGVTSSHTPHVICKDGFKMSVQAGQSLYSTPKDVVDNYEEMEVGYPSEEESTEDFEVAKDETDEKDDLSPF